MKKKKNRFYRIYFSVIAIFLITLIVGVVLLYGWLRSYENSQPTTIVKTVISDYLDKGKFTNLQKDYDLTISEFNTEDDLNNVLSSAIKDKTLTVAHSSLKPEGVDESFVIKAGDDKVLNVFLKKHKIGKGYDIAYVELAKNILNTVEVTMPKGAEVTINGIAIPNDLRVDNEFPSLPESVDKKTLTPTQTAKITGLLTDQVEIKATEGGTESEIIADGNKYTVAQKIDATIGEKVKSTAENAAVAYAAYMQKDGNLGVVAQYCDTSTTFYRSVAGTLIQFVKSHNGYKNEDMSVTALTKYSDSLYSCHVTFKHTLLNNDGTTYPDNFDKIVFVTKDNDTYKVIDMQNPVSTTES